MYYTLLNLINKPRTIQRSSTSVSTAWFI